jgi:hypothetical protein
MINYFITAEATATEVKGKVCIVLSDLGPRQQSATLPNKWHYTSHGYILLSWGKKRNQTAVEV